MTQVISKNSNKIKEKKQAYKIRDFRSDIRTEGRNEGSLDEEMKNDLAELKREDANNSKTVKNEVHI